jgi:hypothetical protein
MTLRRLAVLTFAVAAALPAQGTAPTRAALFLTLPTTARGLALGDGWSAVADDEGALWVDPAQLARVRGVMVGASVQGYIAGTTLAAGAFARRLAGGTAALGVRVLDYGSADGFTPAADPGEVGTATGASLTAQDLALTVGYGRAFGTARRLRVGAAGSLVRQTIAGEQGTTLAGDLGIGYTTSRGWDVAAALQHLGGALRLAAVSAPLPWAWRVGFAAPAITTTHLTLRPMAEARQWNGSDGVGVLATEATWRESSAGPVLAARIGYTIHGNADDRSPVTLGGGVSFGPLTVDYAFQGFEVLGGATHRVGVRYAARAR